VIYFVRLASGAIKIGYTEFLDQRLVGLRYSYRGKAELLHAMEGGYETERELHAQFGHLRLGRSEQFQPGPDLLAFMGRQDLASHDHEEIEIQAKRKRPRITMHLSLSPEAARRLKALCDRPISPIDHSAMVEHLIMGAG
jgi:hypothetical protein